MFLILILSLIIALGYALLGFWVYKLGASKWVMAVLIVAMLITFGLLITFFYLDRKQVQIYTFNHSAVDARTHANILMSECVGFNDKRMKLDDVGNAYIKDAAKNESVLTESLILEKGCLTENYKYYDGYSFN